LKTAAANSVRAVAIDLSGTAPKRREMALLFARKFDVVDDFAIESIRKLLKDRDWEGNDGHYRGTGTEKQAAENSLYGA
jgi:hypothetical protein